MRLPALPLQMKRKFERFVSFVDFNKNSTLILSFKGTLPYMAIESLLSFSPFFHQPRHDLESILYIIVYVCTFTLGPSKLYMPPADARTYTSSLLVQLREIGYRKMAHIQCSDFVVIPEFTSYWADFAPYVKELISASFPTNAFHPNELEYDQVLQILENAYNVVEEPPKIETSLERSGDRNTSVYYKQQNWDLSEHQPSSRYYRDRQVLEDSLGRQSLEQSRQYLKRQGEGSSSAPKRGRFHAAETTP